MTSKSWQHRVLEDVPVVLDRRRFDPTTDRLQIDLGVFSKRWDRLLLIQLELSVLFPISWVSSCFLAPRLDRLPFISGLLQRQLLSVSTEGADANFNLLASSASWITTATNEVFPAIGDLRINDEIQTSAVCLVGLFLRSESLDLSFS